MVDALASDYRRDDQFHFDIPDSTEIDGLVRQTRSTDGTTSGAVPVIGRVRC